MPYPAKAIAFDLDAESLASLREAFPSCDIEAVEGSNSASLLRYGSPGGADLLIVAAQPEWKETLGLCRELRSQPNQAYTPLLVLVPPAQEALVAALLAAGAHSCLILPIHTKDLGSVFSRALAGNRPGRHTLGSDRAQCPDAWRDEGGEG
ncbi:MAG TPA: hypothetical protein VFA18_11085 [Gemmataceae bacterium]|nr:hypothetical protein [Gemmataceae bacterium]